MLQQNNLDSNEQSETQVINLASLGASTQVFNTNSE